MATVDLKLPDPYGHAPLRRPGSARRTASIDVTWPRGRQENATFRGLARDVYTPTAGGTPVTVAFDEMLAEIGTDRTILAINASPARMELERLVGISGAGKLRAALDSLVQDGHVGSSPLRLLIDDIPGVIVVSDWAWSRWPQFYWKDEERRREKKLGEKEGVCIGFRPGSSALDTKGEYQNDQTASVLPLVHPEDPQGWHHLPDLHEVSLRRARCIDVWVASDIEIEARFQDSATTPDGGRIAVHEYSLRVSVEPTTQVLKAISAKPHILPFPECPAATGNLSLLLGTPVAQLRTTVLQLLRRTLGCTHLNDAIRALADVPELVDIVMNPGH